MIQVTSETPEGCKETKHEIRWKPSPTVYPRMGILIYLLVSLVNDK